MMQRLRHGAWIIAIVLPLIGGCASDGCEFLVYEEDAIPVESRPLVIPEGVTAPPESGAFSVPNVPNATVGRCMAEPPLVLPEDVLHDPESES